MVKPTFLSHFIDENTPVCGGTQNTISFNRVSSISQGDSANSSRISLPYHAGTHLDFPFHFNDTGKSSSDFPAEFWIFNKVGYLDCSIDQVPDKISSLPGDVELLILKTGFGEKRHEEAY